MSTIVTIRDTETGETHENAYAQELDAVRRWSDAELYINTEPVSVTTDALKECGITLDPADVVIRGGYFLVDGMPLDQWSEAMTMA